VQRRTLAHGFLGTRWRIEWTTDGPTHFYISSFVSAFLLCTFILMFEQFYLLSDNMQNTTQFQLVLCVV